MTDDLIFTSSGILALSTEEQKILTDFLDAHDRAGLYMAYNAMTDSEEAKISVTVHSTISTDE
jgi:putative aminopeptidase FrvX